MTLGPGSGVSAFIMELGVFLFGLCVGSFLNVCIHRVPLSKSIVFPASACPACGTAIRFYDNIPIFSYVLLRGKCRACKALISPRYPLVELITGLFAWAVFAKFGPGLSAVVHFAFIAALLVITFIDIDHQIIPDRISLPAIPILVACSFFIPEITLFQSLLGLVAGGGSLWLVAWVYAVLKKKQGMGGGDIKLLAMIGALLGPLGVVFTVFFASAVGAIVGILVMARQKGTLKQKIPFGPFLAMCAIAYIFLGDVVIQWYVGMF